MYLMCTSLARPIHFYGGGGVYDPYCCQSAGGGQHVLASLLESCRTIHLYYTLYASIMTIQLFIQLLSPSTTNACKNLQDFKFYHQSYYNSRCVELERLNHISVARYSSLNLSCSLTWLDLYSLAASIAKNDHLVVSFFPLKHSPH